MPVRRRAHSVARANCLRCASVSIDFEVPNEVCLVFESIIDDTQPNCCDKQSPVKGLLISQFMRGTCPQD